jgi:nucleoside-diphosphate-sugar epimerase
MLHLNTDHTILNIDKKAPLNDSHIPMWKKCDLMQFNDVENIIKEFKPQACIHLAAETEIVEGKSLTESYPVNTIGSKFLLQLLLKYGVRRTIVVSTQYVCGPSERLPEKPDDYWPHTEYGKSKIELEKNTRKILEPGSFFIVRPTYVWGPWNYKNFNEVVKTIVRRIYIYPKGKKVFRSFAYVGNVCAQIASLLEVEKLDRDWFYLGDEPVNAYEFINGLSRLLTSKNVRTVPWPFLFVLAKVGDCITFAVKFPFTSFRYRNMTIDYKTPMASTFSALGNSPISFNKALNEFNSWYLKNGRK